MRVDGKRRENGGNRKREVKGRKGTEWLGGKGRGREGKGNILYYTIVNIVVMMSFLNLLQVLLFN